MKFTITQTDTFDVEAETAQEAYDLFIDDMDAYFSHTEGREITDEDGKTYDFEE